MFNYSVCTTKSFSEAIAAVEASLAENNFGVLWQLNVKDQLKKKGLDLAMDFQILEVCNSPKAKEVLEINPLVGYFLPCKIVVYVDKGDTVIGMVRPTTIVTALDDDTLTGFAREVEDILIRAIDAAAQ